MSRQQTNVVLLSFPLTKSLIFDCDSSHRHETIERLKKRSNGLLLHPQVFLKLNYTIHANASKHREGHLNNSITVITVITLIHRRLNVNHANYSYFDYHVPCMTVCKHIQFTLRNT